MATFIKLEDSPMFQKQLFSLEETADELKDRCQTLYKGCKKFTEALGIACNGDTTFADSLEAFGGGKDDPVSVSMGGLLSLLCLQIPLSVITDRWFLMILAF
ncbi:ADP-ribosylation factor GTPase-activating protein AGD2-like [Pistacia vera]|uniref:Uncharacterized protein n=1 Tax=Pistacia integerrima TaxID=434235 RepID=A0ACC0YLQ2_9ROSI|nr:ADP-ribosylation factor GTPase-activating protein AGD2-like [Pistacia vera]KAJ0038945.1 hypothetical protein Pint_22632 [Pistacia integerrima]